MRILITGASGMLGECLVAELASDNDVVGLSRSRPAHAVVPWIEADIASPLALREPLEQARPDVIVHAAALTDVDRCERDAALARQVNELAVGALADHCEAHGARLVHVSTDAVFDGTKPGPYVESDATAPPNVYGRTKLAGEALALRARGALVLRTNIFGWRHTGAPGLAEWILNGLRTGTTLTMFRDVMFSPLAATLLAGTIRRCIAGGLSGLFHAGGADVLSKLEFALRIAAAYGLSTAGIRSISVDEKGMAATRSKNLSMDSSRLAAALGVPPAGIDDSIAAWKASEPLQRGLKHG